MMRTFMQNTIQSISKLETQLVQLASHVAEREQGKFPSQTVPNPKGQNNFNTAAASSSSHFNEHVQAVVTLRSVKQIDNNVKLPDERGNVDKEDAGKEAGPTQSNQVPKAPYPQRFQKPKADLHGDIFDTFKHIQINIPFLDAIKQIPSYAKFLKDLVTAKRRRNVPKKALLTEQVSSIILNQYPVKYKDPGSPTISCRIGDHLIDKALLDLGASVNILQYSVYLQMGLGDLKPTKMRIQLADRSVIISRGIIEDVMVKIEHFTIL